MRFWTVVDAPKQKLSSSPNHMLMTEFCKWISRERRWLLQSCQSCHSVPPAFYRSDIRDCCLHEERLNLLTSTVAAIMYVEAVPIIDPLTIVWERAKQKQGKRKNGNTRQCPWLSNTDG